MSKQFEKLVGLLKELFQLDQPDLDFGLYRIMHAKADEISQFLDKDLLPQAKDAFSQYQTADKADLEKELAKAMEQAKSLGVDPDSTAKVQELRQKLADESVDITALENDVYDHLFSFFRRYYHEGDFLAKRVYKPGVYAIPYEGEEVKLHWANRDQYYIKTSEYLRDYAFTLKPGDAKDAMRVHFRLVEAAEGGQGNVKAINGRERVFILAAEDFIAEEDGELVIHFHYRPATMNDWSEDGLADATTAAKKKPPVQKVLLVDAVKRVLSVDEPNLQRWIPELTKDHIKVDGKAANHSRLEGHLNRYTKRHTFDYFIHKDLSGFLRRELDFFIKNEVMHLDDIENESVARVEQYLSKIKVVRKIANKVVDFLSQLEDFQKKLWLKKKFVVETNYFITVDLVSEDFYKEIAENEAQIKEWIELFAIDGIEGASPYTDPVTEGFIKNNRNLVIDTNNFDENFKYRLLNSIDELHKSTCGTVIHSDNFHALNLIEKLYKGSIECVFNDPPYNTGLGDFLYKDNYQHSSWACMIENCYQFAKRLIRDDGAVWTVLDSNESTNYQKLAEEIFGKDCFIDTVGWTDIFGWEKVYSPRMDAKQFSTSMDFIHVFAGIPNWSPNHLKIDPNPDQFPHIDENGDAYRSDPLRKWGKNSLRTNRENLWYPITSPDGVEVWPIKPDGTEGCWRWQNSTVKQRYDELDWLDKGHGLQPYVRQYANKSNWRPVETLWEYEDVGSTHESAEELKALLPGHNFQTVKPTGVVKRAVEASGDEYSTTLDFFAGSGTTGHAIIDLNREDAGRRRFILVESGEYIDTLLIPRLKKVVYSNDWRNGKPVDRSSGTSGVFKVVRLESYEDAVNNLRVSRGKEQESLLDNPKAQGSNGIREEYLLRYMLNVETRGSRSLLNVEAFNDPTAYKLKVRHVGGDESREINVDLLETFNYLIGLLVDHLAAPQTFDAVFKRDEEGRLRIDGRLKQEEGGLWRIRTVDGAMPDGRKTLVIWRNLTDDAEQDNLVLDEWFTRSGYSTQDYEFDLIYVNGDNNLENLREPDETWKVRLIEDDFHRLMFDVENA